MEKSSGVVEQATLLQLNFVPSKLDNTRAPGGKVEGKCTLEDDDDRESMKARSPASKSLKLAFKHEVAPKEYLFRVWVTAIISAGYFAYAAASRSGHFDLSFLIPMGGTWQGHDPAGVLYLETWSTILVNSLQAGFALWGGVLMFLGFFRIFTRHKYVFACFYLGSAFLGFVLVLPNWTQILLNMLIEKCPVLVQ